MPHPLHPTKTNKSAVFPKSAAAHYLAPLFIPRSVALVGASSREGSLGRFVFENMLAAGFSGEIYPVNPKYKSIFDRPTFASVTDLPTVPDLVVIVCPAHTVADILHDAGVRGVPAALVLSAGFAEIGKEGKIRARLIAAELKRYGMRMLGPNCVGLMRPAIGLNATFANATAKPGAMALVSQSGAVCTAILDWAATTEIGFSSVISLGGALDLDFGDVLDFLVHDPETKSILMYIEGVRDARRLMSALRAAARVKPVVVLKAGHNQSGKAAVLSHTGALAGSDKVWSSALARAGVVRAKSSMQLFAAARVCSDPRFARSLGGDRLAIITNGGGPGVVAADCADDNHLPLATLEATTIKKLNEVLPVHWSHANPVDIIGDAPAERFGAALAIVLADKNVDAVLAMYCPTAMTRGEDAADAIIPLAVEAIAEMKKPVFTAWLGGASIVTARKHFADAGVANFLTPESAVEAFSHLAKFHKHRTMLLESVPTSVSMSLTDLEQAIATAQEIRQVALAENRTLLREAEAKALLAAFQLPVKVGELVTSRAAAEAAAKKMGFPVVLKIDSPDITHKSDVGGVRLNLVNTRQVSGAFDAIIAAIADAAPLAKINGINVQPMLKFNHSREVLVGISRDATFGSIISFGTGGVAVEVVGDTAVALPPLNAVLAKELIDKTDVAKMLGAYRNIPAIDEAALLDVVVRVSTIACALPWVLEMDLNPVLTHPAGAVIADARIVIDAHAPMTDSRYRHMAIFPYPIELQQSLTLRDGSPIKVRAIRPDDADRERAFVAAMSDTSRYYRFFHSLTALSDEMIARFTQLDYDREMALIALTEDESEIVGVCRYHPNANGVSVEFAIAIADKWQQKGMGRLLMDKLIHCARDADYASVEGSVLLANVGMLKLVAALGFQTEHSSDANDTIRVNLSLR